VPTAQYRTRQLLDSHLDRDNRINRTSFAKMNRRRETQCAKLLRVRGACREGGGGRVPSFAQKSSRRSSLKSRYATEKEGATIKMRFRGALSCEKRGREEGERQAYYWVSGKRAKKAPRSTFIGRRMRAVGRGNGEGWGSSALR